MAASIFCNRRLTYCTNVFWFINVNSVHHKVLLMKFLELYQLLRGTLYTKLFLIYSANFHYLVFHIEYRETTKRFRDRTTSLECLLGSRLLFFTDKPITYLFNVCIKFTYWLIYGINLWKRNPSSANVIHNEFIPSGKAFIYIKNKNGPSADPWLHKSFPLRISSINVTKSTVSCEFGYIYRGNP